MRDAVGALRNAVSDAVEKGCALVRQQLAPRRIVGRVLPTLNGEIHILNRSAWQIGIERAVGGKVRSDFRAASAPPFAADIEFVLRCDCLIHTRLLDHNRAGAVEQFARNAVAGHL